MEYSLTDESQLCLLWYQQLSYEAIISWQRHKSNRILAMWPADILSFDLFLKQQQHTKNWVVKNIFVEAVCIKPFWDSCLADALESFQVSLGLNGEESWPRRMKSAAVEVLRSLLTLVSAQMRVVLGRTSSSHHTTVMSWILLNTLLS